ncbi:replication endonuclease [Marinomonas atlantica]|uniref:replication endonuclease n=2 Tax=Pseudomonadota TaxID=1224 RepID=UPI00082F56CA|nr:replication endonuclease [Marinomonas atlantica]
MHTPTAHCLIWRDKILDGLSPQYADYYRSRLDELDQTKGYVAANIWLRDHDKRVEIDKLLSRLGSMRLCVGQEAKRISKRKNTAAALDYVRGVVARLYYCDEWVMDLTGDKLNDWAAEKSRRFEMSAKGKLVRLHADFFEFVKEQAALAGSMFDSWDDLDKVEALIQRMFTPEWWKRQAKRQYRHIENIRRECGQVCYDQSAYVSRWGIQRHRKQKQANRAYLESMEAVNQYEQKFLLSQLAEKSISNPIHCKAELMVRVKGCQFLAIDHGHLGWFITLTCPSKYHAIHKETGHRNGKFYEFGRPTPRDAQNHLKEVWAAFGKACSNKGINYYGVRVVEPHHDGTPHWHLILFVDPKQSGAMLAEFKKQAFKVDGEEAGAKKSRFEARKLDPAKGGAVAYVAKYVAKNIDGVDADGQCIGVDDETDLDFINSAERVQAWKARHGIRQFQFVGGASVTVWREIRRLKESIPETFIDIYNAAMANDWKQFTVLMGGVHAGRKQTLKPLYESCELNQFGEPKQAIKGLVAATAEYVSTRLYDWLVQRVGSGSGLDLQEAAEPFPRTRVNNSPPPDWGGNYQQNYH